MNVMLFQQNRVQHSQHFFTVILSKQSILKTVFMYDEQTSIFIQVCDETKALNGHASPQRAHHHPMGTLYDVLHINDHSPCHIITPRPGMLLCMSTEIQIKNTYYEDMDILVLPLDDAPHDSNHIQP